MPIPSGNVLVLGAYGLIGYGVTQRLLRDGFQVTGLGRDASTAQRVLPGVPWIERDLKHLCDDADWTDILQGVSLVVNCSGALQDSPNDDLEALHHKAIAALAQACAAQDVALVQISAVGAAPDAATHFMASKGRGDAAIRAAGGSWHILRPGLVLAQNAYGGTTMIRMLAAIPWVQPLAASDAKIQTVALSDVANAVSAAARGKIPFGTELDLVEPDTHSLREVIAKMRQWLGFRPARIEVTLPRFCLTAVSKMADALAYLGWRSPLRSTALAVLGDGVRGTATDLAQFEEPPLSSLEKTLRDMPVGVQDRLFARMTLLMPVILACLCLFWLASGTIGLFRVDAAADILRNVGWPGGLARASVIFWALVDIAIGVAFAFRRSAYGACWAAIGVSLFYLAASTLTVPSLWADPLGPLVKVVPLIVLALVARVTLDAR